MPSLEYVGCKLAISALQLVMKEVASLLKKEFLQAWKIDHKFRELQATYSETQVLLSRLESWQIKETALEPWFQDLDRYCYDTEDIVADLVLILELEMEGEDKKPVSHPLRKNLMNTTVPHKIGELQTKLKDIGDLIKRVLAAEEINSTQTQTQTSGMSSVPYCKSLLSDEMRLLDGTSRDQDKLNIIAELTSQQKSKRGGVSIVGMDGLGKTSLARAILNDKEQFPFVLSACVSAHFQIGDIVHKLVTDCSRSTAPQNHQQPSEPHQDHSRFLKELLRGGSYLIILDDLWSVTDEDWEHFKDNYLNLSSGCKILTTTRNPNVAEVTRSTPYYLNRMTDEDCRKLILHRADLSNVEREIWFNDIEDIARKCMGMPIVANKLGLKMSKKPMGDKRKTCVMQFKMNSLWQLEEFREIFPSLNLNQPKWPPDLKRCFAYCSLFSSNHEFSMEDLIQLWEVEGFIPCQQERRLMQDINQCFEEFLSRSILQPIQGRDKKQTVYKMHELNHEFSHLLASSAFCRIAEGTPNLLSSCKNIRHLSLACTNADESLLKKVEQCEGLRTFLLLHHNKPQTYTISYNFFHKLHKLRLLDLSHTNITQLPKPITPSKHLRCLDLSHSKVKRLPEPICSLHALQILKLNCCLDLLDLPKDLNQLIYLTQLHVEMKTLSLLPANIGKLTKLEVLDSFSVGKVDGCKVVELKDMEFLREVGISGLENIKDKEEAQETMLSRKQYLRKLVLEWDYRPANQVPNPSDILEGLQPHNYLAELVVRNYSGQQFPTWLISPSCQLVSINLDSCPNCQILPSLAQLPVLKNLVLRSFHGERSLDGRFLGEGERVYPCLELLEINDMRGLVDWTGLKAGDMPRLLALKIVVCPMLVNVPSFEHLSCLTSLEINDCPKLQALPELPSSLNGISGELVIMFSPLVRKRCEAEGPDLPKIKDIQYVEIDGIRKFPKSIIQPQKEKDDEVSTDQHQPANSILVDGNDVVQNGHQDPATTQTPNNEIQMVQDPNYKERTSKGKQKVDEGSSSNQVLDEASQLRRNVTLSKDRDEHHSVVQTEGHGRPSKKRSSRGFARSLFGCFSKGHGMAPSSEKSPK